MATLAERLFSLISAFLRLVLIALGVIAMAMSVLLLVVCRTMPGIVFGVGGLSLGAALVFAMCAWDQRSRILWRRAGVALGTWLVATGYLVVKAPAGHAAQGAAVQQRYVSGRDAFRRFALGNLLPEGDQLALGFRLMPAADPLFTTRQAAALSRLSAAIYAEVEADAAFHALGSVMPDAYDELWGLPFNRGHYYLYIPPRLNRSVPRPVIVFLHGSGGNFKAYTWLLAKVADKLGTVLIAPSYGIGDWHEPDTTRVVQAALDDATRIVSIDPASVHLMGLSNGGLGVSQIGRAAGSSIRSLTFLSPVIDPDCISSREFRENWRGRSILVISGGKDDRVSINFVTAEVEAMTQLGAHVTFKNFDDADHFMFFSHQVDVFRTIVDWLEPQLSSAHEFTM